MMKPAIIFIISMSMLVLAVQAQMTLAQNFQFEGNTRKYQIYLPANYVAGSVRPLIIQLHGYSSTMSAEQAQSKWMPIADTAGFLVVYPGGLKDSVQNQYWNVGWPWMPNTNDIGFVSALIDTIHARFNIDLNKVYASGFSNGGFMAFLLGAKLSNKIAAIASVSGSMVPQVYDTLVPERPIPTLAINGTSDSVIPYNGGGGQLASVDIDSVFFFWGRNNLCGPDIETTVLPDLNHGDGSTVQLLEFNNEACVYPSRLYKIIGGEHFDWPGSVGNKDFNAGIEIWNFFKPYSLDNISSVDKSENRHEIPFSIYPVPADDEVTIQMNSFEGINNSYLLTLMNSMGEVLLKEKINPVNSVCKLSTNNLVAGVYLITISSGIKFSTSRIVKSYY